MEREVGKVRDGHGWAVKFWFGIVEWFKGVTARVVMNESVVGWSIERRTPAKDTMVAAGKDQGWQRWLLFHKRQKGKLMGIGF
ncbi:hypothetical protein V6N13_019022 [Hibiscus sabdariffa]